MTSSTGARSGVVRSSPSPESKTALTHIGWLTSGFSRGCEPMLDRLVLILKALGLTALQDQRQHDSDGDDFLKGDRYGERYIC